MKSTKDYPDEVINFMRNHPTMYNAVYPVHKRPLVVRTNVDYEFTTITVDQVAAADGSYEVLFLGTGESTGDLASLATSGGLGKPPREVAFPLGRTLGLSSREGGVLVCEAGPLFLHRA